MERIHSEVRNDSIYCTAIQVHGFLNIMKTVFACFCDITNNFHELVLTCPHSCVLLVFSYSNNSGYVVCQKNALSDRSQILGFMGV
jgi:hypothetical protein